MSSVRKTGRHAQRNGQATQASSGASNHGSGGKEMEARAPVRAERDMTARVKDTKEKIRVLRARVADTRAKWVRGRELPESTPSAHEAIHEASFRALMARNGSSTQRRPPTKMIERVRKARHAPAADAVTDDMRYLSSLV